MLLSIMVLHATFMTGCSSEDLYDDDDQDEQENPLSDDSDAIDNDDASSSDYPVPDLSSMGVDLGLSVKWAMCNVGASSPSDYGDYFAWGEIVSKEEYTEANSVTYGVEMESIEGVPMYDVATAKWGEPWRLPTVGEIDELIDSCQWNWDIIDEHSGYTVTGPSGNSIFLPATGWYHGVSLNDAGDIGHYWSAVPNNAGDADTAYYLYFHSDGDFGGHWGYRDYGFPVRPVSAE